MPIHFPSFIGAPPEDYYRYAVHEYRYGDTVTIWVGKEGRAKRTWNVWLRVWIFNSPAERIRRKREKAERLSEKLNHREMYLNHEVEISRR